MREKTIYVSIKTTFKRNSQIRVVGGKCRLREITIKLVAMKEDLERTDGAQIPTSYPRAVT